MREKFTFVQSAAVAVGAFNTHIIHPAWLIREGIVPEDPKPDVEVDFSQPGFRLQFKGSKSAWTVRPDRLVIESKDPASHLGQLVSQIVRKLPYTPITAVGLNYEFEGLHPLEIHPDESSNFPLQFNEGYSIKRRTWVVSLSKPEEITVRNLGFAVGDKKHAAFANFHVETKQLDAEQIAAELDRHQDCYLEAKKLISSAFGITVQ